MDLSKNMVTIINTKKQCLKLKTVYKNDNEFSSHFPPIHNDRIGGISAKSFQSHVSLRTTVIKNQDRDQDPRKKAKEGMKETGNE